ncbi:OB-fold domain-containing protein [Novosphingobium sp.]|uniref:Zn-ribbon domain-containing OB-fold protein n=1 Tax=Novosphingobium sp. TaxID=1874826 RepID=UPI0026049926|nr:OB-fold domain-containing protein [Novosphingobium sp.]
MEVVTALPSKPANALVQISGGDAPWLRGFRCSECGAVVAEATLCCRACGCRNAPQPVNLGTRGTLFTWSVVHRSFPGVAVPFVSAIVDLEGGLTLKATLRTEEPEGLRAGLPLQLVFDDAGGATDADGAAYVGFHFVPVSGALA